MPGTKDWFNFSSKDHKSAEYGSKDNKAIYKEVLRGMEQVINSQGTCRLQGAAGGNSYVTFLGIGLE